MTDYSTEMNSIALSLREIVKQNDKLLAELNDIKHELILLRGKI